MIESVILTTPDGTVDLLGTNPAVATGVGGTVKVTITAGQKGSINFYIFGKTNKGLIAWDASDPYTFVWPTDLVPDNYKVTIEHHENKMEDKKNVTVAVNAAPVVKTGSISGLLWNDSNADGKLSPGEGPTGLRVVYIDTNKNGVADTSELKTTSDANGAFKFDNLAPGTYNVSRVFPAGYHISNSDTPYITATVKAGQNTVVNIGTKTSVVVNPPAPDNDSTNTTIHGTIIETSKAEAAAKACGFTLWRDWCSVNWHTGQINDSTDIAGVNAKVKRCWKVILTVTVDEKATRDKRGTMCADFSTVADQLIKGGLDKSVIVQLVNEANLDSYWPNGDVKQATVSFAVPIAKKLKAAGYTVAAPSITYGATDKITDWVDNYIMANSPDGLWDYLDAHLYADYNQFKVTFANWDVLAKKHGVKLMSSEWSHKAGNKAFALEVANFFTLLDKYCDIHCNFSFTYGAKFNPLNSYCWKDGVTTEVYDAIKKILNP